MIERPSLHSIWRRMHDDPRRVFIHSPSGVFRYRALSGLIGRFCNHFDRLTIPQGSRVLLVTGNEPLAAGAYLASLLDGLVPVMLSPDSKPDRINAICASVEPRFLVIDQGLANGVSASAGTELSVLEVPASLRLEEADDLFSMARQRIGRLVRVDPLSACPDLSEGRRVPRLPTSGDELAYILFTSGTTSSPSGVEISRTALLAHLQTLNRLFSYTSDSRIFNPTPLAHTDGLVQGLLLAAANGAVLLRPGAFDLSGLEEWLDRLVGMDATHFVTNPTILGLIYRFAAHDDYFRHPGFFGILSSASILRPDLWQNFESRFGCSIYNMYGMTETVANATYAGRHPEMGRIGSIGLAVDCEVRLMEIQPDGSVHGSADEGELQIRGENVFGGYWNDPERTSRTLLSSGWMRTGDLARRGPDGSLDIIGRLKTMINMGGQSILPEEIDEVLAEHPAIVDVATVGLSDPEFEEVAVAAVVLERPVNENELLAHCRSRLERLKVPKRIVIVEKIPRADAGKPKTAELRKLLQSVLSAAPKAEQESTVGEIGIEAVCELAADVFQVSVTKLESASSPATVEGWDSFNQLNLMIEAESRFGIRIPAAQVASIRTLGDLLNAIRLNR